MRIFLACRAANGARRYRANADSVIREKGMEWCDFTAMCGETKGRRLHDGRRGYADRDEGDLPAFRVSLCAKAINECFSERVVN